MSDELPSGWVSAKFDEVVDVLDFEREPINSSERAQRIEGKSHSALFPYFGATGQVGWIDEYRSDGERVLLGEDAAPFLDPIKDKAYLANGRFWVNNHAHVLRGAVGLVNNRYLCHQLNYVDYHPFVSGSTRLKLTSSAMKQIPMVIAPAAEQTRIVEKLEELLSDLDAGVAELKAAQKKLGQYRQSLLKAAVEGALTAEWRASKQTPSPQPLPRQGGGASSFVPLPPRGGGAGGEGANSLATEDEPWLQARARELRQQQTPDEQALWQQLRAKRFSGHKFRRQQVLGRFIVDFVCFAQRLIVELDGGQHAEAVDYDNHRDTWLEQQGFRVLRFWNNEWSKQPEAVLESIWQALQQEHPLPNQIYPPRYALPARGEGLMAPLPPCGGGAGGEGESGAQLLVRILTERRARWEAKQLAKFAEQGKIPPKDWQKKYPEPVQPDTTDLPELPGGWVWATINQLTEFITSGSRGWADYYANSGATFIRSQNINKDRLDLTDIAFVNPPSSAEGARTRVQKEDLLLTITGANVGKAARVDVDIDEAYVSQHVSLLRMIETKLADYLHVFLTSSAGGRGQLDKEAYGAGKPGLNLQQVAAVAVPLPSMSEISTLIEAVATYLKSANDQETAITTSLKQSAAQRKNILKTAFSGQLVPQDPNDEPAAVLLERIRAERAERDTVKKPRGRKSKETV